MTRLRIPKRESMSRRDCTGKKMRRDPRRMARMPSPARSGQALSVLPTRMNPAMDNPPYPSLPEPL